MCYQAKRRVYFDKTISQISNRKQCLDRRRITDKQRAHKSIWKDTRHP